MGKRTSYEPGTFSYVELHTTDTEGAKRYYGDLFGWEGEDLPIPEAAGGGTYTLLKLGGETVAALTPQAPQQRDAGVPPNWFSYVTVASADDTAAKATELGGAVHAGPFDVMDVGRMAVIGDPTGAMLGAWQAGSSIGATLVNDPGCLTSNELATNDVARAQEFYAGLLGWNFEAMDTGGAPPYWLVQHSGAVRGLNGGMRELGPEQTAAGIPPHWMPYFTVESTDATVSATTAAGGGVLAPAFDIPAGRIAVLHDPQGAAFGVFEGEIDD
jgi:predicted enzyme related to lactoylglutathione lyase